MIFPRDARFLNWRFVDCPEPTYRRFVAERGGRAVGYVVLRRAEPVELPQGIIVDLYASRRDAQTVDELVRHSLAFFGDRCFGGGLWHLGPRIRGRAAEARLLQNPGSSSDLRLPRRRPP